MSSVAGETAGIERTLRAYEAALNASSAADVLPLYTADGVFMAPFGPSAVGIEAVEAAYGRVFAAIELKVVFHIAEIVPLAPDWAMARTNSTGTCLVHATGARTEANQELFVLQRVADAWKIARYSFSTTNPPPGIGG